MSYGDFQNEIYAQGLVGVAPALPMAYADWEARAQQALPPSILSYVAGGAGDEHTQHANVAAFSQWGLMPRMLVGAIERDLSVELWGQRWAAPVFMAPIGVIGVCAQDGHGDVAAAQASARTGVPMVASTLTVDPMEQVKPHTGDVPSFFQLYTPTDRELAESFIHRAEAAGYSGIVITLDTWITGWRPRDLGTANFPQLRGNCLTNYLTDPVFQAKCGIDAQTLERDPRSAAAYWAGIFGQSVTWEDLDWLRTTTTLPLILFRRGRGRR